MCAADTACVGVGLVGEGMGLQTKYKHDTTGRMDERAMDGRGKGG